MKQGANSNKIVESIHLSPGEEKNIEQKVSFELTHTGFQLIKGGTFANSLAGLLFIWAFHSQFSLTTLITWYCTVLLINLMNVVLAVSYQHVKPDFHHITPWRVTLYLIMSALTLTWGSIGILFLPHDPQYQLYFIFFLFSLLVAFGVGSISDFITTCISMTGLLTPYISFQIYSRLNPDITGYESNLNLQFSASLFILGIFLLIASYIGNKLIQKSTKLSFINENLNSKLEVVNKELATTNKFLDQKVQERTIELEKSLKLVTHQATHDLLTDLPNQRLLHQYLEKAITNAKQKHQSFGVIFMGLNRIKNISDSLGHQAVNMVIKTVAQRLTTFAERQNANTTKSANTYTITHAWGDVFVILATPFSMEAASNTCRDLFSILQEPIDVGDNHFNLTASIGLCLYPKDGENIKSLLINAEAAMFRAKIYGGNKFEFYTAELNAHKPKQLELESDLYKALSNNELTIYYQPIINVKTGAIHGMEALIRWIHPIHGMISPADFVPIAEETGLIIPVGEWVLKQACAQTYLWHKSGFPNLKVAVNLAPKQLANENIVNVIKNVLKETGLPAHMLELEFTESAILDEKVIPIAKSIKELGISLSIDDFGTGYSGLSYVKQFSINKLKIDKSFVQDFHNKESRAIILTVIDMAKKLEVQTLAEGVETEDQYLFLKEHHCDFIQGYYFSRPIDVEKFTQLLYNNNFKTAGNT